MVWLMMNCVGMLVVVLVVCVGFVSWLMNVFVFCMLFVFFSGGVSVLLVE